MSKNPNHLWQRLKRLFKFDTPAANSVAKTPARSATKQADPMANASASNAHLIHPPINVAFDEDTDLAQFASSASESVETELDGSAIQPIHADDIEHILTNMGYQFMYHPASENDGQTLHHYTMQVSDKERHWGCLIRFFGEQQLMAVYSIYPTAIAETNRPEMLAMLAYLNYDLIVGNLEMDVLDGELRFKTSLDLEVTGVNEMIMSYLLQSNFSIFSRLYDTISDMIEQPHITHDLQGAVDKLIESQQSRNFFLASDVIQ